MYIYKISNLQPSSCTLLESAALGIPQTLKIKSKKPLSKKEVFMHANRYLKERFNVSIDIPVETPKKYKPMVNHRKKLYNENVDFLGLGILVENTVNDDVIQWVRNNFLDTVDELASKKTIDNQGKSVLLYPKGLFISTIVNALIDKYIDTNPDTDLPSRDNIEYFIQQSLCDHISFIIDNEESPVSVNQIVNTLLDELGIRKDETKKYIEDMEANGELAFSEDRTEVYRPADGEEHLAGNSEIVDLDLTDDIVSDKESGDYEHLDGYSIEGGDQTSDDAATGVPSGYNYNGVYGGDLGREINSAELEQNRINRILQQKEAQKRANALQANQQAKVEVPEEQPKAPENAKVKKLSDLANMFMDEL